MWYELLIKGIAVGICASAPLGPIGVICVQRTINKGPRSGLASGYGAAIADTLFAAIAMLGLSYIIDFISAHEQYITLGGGALILTLGAVTLTRNPLRQLRKARAAKRHLAEDLLWVLLLTLTNPLAIFLFLALFTWLHVDIPQDGQWMLFLPIIGVHVGAIAWWALLTHLVSRFRYRFRLRQIWWFNKIAGALISAIGVTAIILSLI